MSRRGGVILWTGLVLALALGVGACSSTEATAEVGQQCDQEGERDGELVCEDGTWVEDSVGADAGVDADPDDDCEPESHREFCERYDVECGSFSGVDNCDRDRSVHCGEFEGFECDESTVCLYADDSEELETNRCRCPDLGDEPADEVCDRAGAECGTIDAAGVCEEWDDVGEVECGDCEDVDGECGEDVDNLCGCPCEVDGTCYGIGESSPDDACLVCDPEESSEEFVEADDGTECDDDAVCQGGDCVCEEEATECGDECVDLDSSRNHCGECDNDCGDDEVCDDGVCQQGCPDDETLCGGECVDTETSLEHCGGCNDECSSGDDEATAECDGGQCSVECDDEELTYCTDECVDTETDDDHCGACGTECGDLATCFEGSCEGIGGECNEDDDCGPAQECCDGDCIGPTENCPDD